MVCANGACSIIRACSDIGYNDRAAITLQTSSGLWSSGIYTLTIEAGATKGDCNCVLDSTAGMLRYACSPAAPLQISTPTLDCVEEGGVDHQLCRDDAGPFEVRIQLVIHGAPAQVAITVAREGQVIVMETVSPQYWTNEPNGPQLRRRGVSFGVDRHRAAGMTGGPTRPSVALERKHRWSYPAGSIAHAGPVKLAAMHRRSSSTCGGRRPGS